MQIDYIAQDAHTLIDILPWVKSNQLGTLYAYLSPCNPTDLTKIESLLIKNDIWFISM